MENKQETNNEADEKRPKKRRKVLRWIVLFFLVFLIGGLVWLNGPGWRWIGPKVAAHFMEGTGMQAKFELEGRLTGGISVKNLSLTSDSTLAGLSARRVALVYRFRDLVRGKIDGIEVDGLHAELGLVAEKKDGDVDEPVEEGEKEALDLEDLVKTLRTVREKVIPISVTVTDLSLDVTRDGHAMLSLAESAVHHKAGESEVKLDVGEITDAVGHVWPARESEILWNEGDFTINRLDPLPGVGVRALVLGLPESGAPSVEAELHVDDAVFVASAPPGLTSVVLTLREGELRSEQVAERFGLELPASGVLRSLSVHVGKLLPEPKEAIGSVQLLLEDVVYEEWTVPELSLDVDLESDRASVAARGVALGTEVSLDGEAVLVRSLEEFQLGNTRGHFNVAEVSAVVGSLAEKVEVIDADAEFPASMLDGDFKLSFSDNKPVSADVDLVLKPGDAEEVSSIAVKGGWQSEKPVSAEVELEGVKLAGEYDIEAGTYNGSLDLDDFKSGRIDAWLAVVKAGTDGAVQLTGKWKGDGRVKKMEHRGALVLGAASYAKEGMPEVKAGGEIHYDWPGSAEIRSLNVEAAEQKVFVNLKLGDGMLTMADLKWVDGETAMLDGSASLPVPEDFSKWREMLANDERAVEVDIQSKVLPLTMLKDIVPEVEEMVDAKSTAELRLRVSGSYENPELDALIDLKDLASPKQPDLPSADVKLKLETREGVLMLDGSVKTPEFDPVLVKASMAFKPADWAENPELLMEEGFNARVDLPKVQLSRFSGMAPMVKTLEGVLSGNLEAGGHLAKPVIKGRIDLTAGGAVLKSPDFPAVKDVTMSVDLAMDRIVLKELNAQVAGGTLKVGGSLELNDFKPGALDFRVKGSFLPVLRNDSLIVRSNVDLKLAGPWESAVLSGTVGIVDSLFYRDIELIPVGKPFTSPSAASLPRVDAVGGKPTAAVPEPFSNWSLNVVARTETPFLVRGNFATGQVDANIKVGGTVGNPAPDGEVKISDFRAALPLSTLKVRSGTVVFKPASGLDPIIEIRGSAEPRPYRVNMFVYGRASDPQLVLTSNPPLPENEIMTLLATGTTTSGLEDPQAASSRAFQLLAEEFRRGRLPLGKQLRPVLGLLDKVDFSVAEEDPYSSAEYSTATLSLTDQWYISAGMGAEGESRFLGMWRFSFK